MKNFFLLILAASFLTAFKSNTESKQLLANSTLELQQNKKCIFYENYTRKFITYLIKAPLSTTSSSGTVFTNIPDFSHSAILDKFSGKYLMHFKAISGKNRFSKRVAFTKQLTSNNSKSFQVNLIIPNIDYSNVKHVKDIYLNPSNNKRYMKIVSLQGQEFSHEIVLSEGSGAGEEVDYIGWNYKCLE